MRTVVAVVRGGPSGEHEVSLKTGKAVLDALSGEQYELLDILVDKSGKWHREGVQLPPDEVLRGVDLVFNALHGTYGGDGTVQRVYEALGVRHTGSGSFDSKRAFNKGYTKKIAEENNIKVPRYAAVLRGADIEEEARRIVGALPLPLIVKPMMGSSSLAMTYADTYDVLVNGIRSALKAAPAVLVEEFIQGKDATAGVVEQLNDEDHCALPPFEIIMPPGRLFYDFEAKYSEGSSSEECPGSLTNDEQKAITNAARTMHGALELMHYSRSDFRVNESGVHYLETNSDPVLGEDDLLPRSLTAVDRSFPHFVDHVINLTRQQMTSSTTRISRPRYAKYYTRTLSVIECELWQRGERIELPAMNEARHFFHPLFAFTPGKGAAVYYNMADPRQDPRTMAYYFNDNRQEFFDILQASKQYFSELEQLLDSKSSLPVVFHYLAKAWPGLALANTFASECRDLVDNIIGDAALRLFAENEKKMYEAEASIREWLAHNLPEDIRPYASVVKFDEVIAMRFPEQWELEARKKSFVLYRGTLFAAPLRDVARRNGLIIKESSREFTGHLRGSIACCGRTRGPARVIFESSQLGNVQEGDVLITSMTTPDMQSALHRAVAIVTDEGSLTSEAVIMARGMDKPFVTGTEYATEFLKDGDMVEVDAEEGVVRLLRVS